MVEQRRLERADDADDVGDVLDQLGQVGAGGEGGFSGEWHAAVSLCEIENDGRVPKRSACSAGCLVGDPALCRASNSKARRERSARRGEENSPRRAQRTRRGSWGGREDGGNGEGTGKRREENTEEDGGKRRKKTEGKEWMDGGRERREERGERRREHRGRQREEEIDREEGMGGWGKREERRGERREEERNTGGTKGRRERWERRRSWGKKRRLPARECGAGRGFQRSVNPATGRGERVRDGLSFRPARSGPSRPACLESWLSIAELCDALVRTGIRCSLVAALAEELDEAAAVASGVRLRGWRWALAGLGVEGVGAASCAAHG